VSAIRKKLGLAPAELERMVVQCWGLDPEPFEPAVTSCFGQALQIIEADGTWSARLNFEHIGYGAQKLEWAQTFHANPLVEWLYRSSVIERIQTHIDVRPMFALAPHIGELALPAHEEDIAPAVLEWASTLIASQRAGRRPHLITGAKALFQWAVEALLPGFWEADLDTLDTSYVRSRLGHAVTFLDVDRGPFTSSELVRIERALHSYPEWHRERALFYLCRDWGLRPIQLVLLRVEDFDADEAGPYIWVPSVKGIRRSRLRRSPKNLKKRYLTDAAASALSAYIENNISEVTRVRLKIADDANATTDQVEMLPVPLFPGGSRPRARTRRIYSDPALRPYALHSDALWISREIVGWSERLMLLAQPRGRDHQGTPSRMEFCASRFRRAKATSMVMSGHSPEDVAEALDHCTVANVQHYFRFNLELIDFVNASHNSSVEITEAVAFWSGRISSQDSLTALGDMRVANLGICKSIEVCQHHPTVTCYSCPKFRPFKEADHGAAQRVIEDLRDRVREHGTGPVRIQIDAALAGVHAVIKAIANDSR